MARKKARRPGSPRRKVPSSGARTNRLTKNIISRGDRSGKPPSLEVRERVFAAVAAVRRAEARGETLLVSQAARQESTTVAAIKRFPQLLKRTKPGKPLQVTKNDTYSRSVSILIPLRLHDGDVRTIKVRSYKEAQLASNYATTVRKVRDEKLLPSALNEFKGVTLGREKYPLLTDYKKIKRLADAGISIVEFYAKPGGAGALDGTPEPRGQVCA